MKKLFGWPTLLIFALSISTFWWAMFFMVEIESARRNEQLDAAYRALAWERWQHVYCDDLMVERVALEAAAQGLPRPRPSNAERRAAFRGSWVDIWKIWQDIP